MQQELNENQELKQKIKEQEKVIEILSNQEIVRGLTSALKDVKNRDYLVLSN